MHSISDSLEPVSGSAPGALVAVVRRSFARFSSDPRHFQIAALGGLVAYSLVALDFGARPLDAAVSIAACLGFQWAFGRWYARVPFDWRSPLISGLGLAMLLRVDAPWMAAGAALLAIAGKFLIRWNGRHLFNPTNLALALLILFTDRAWVSPGQWGSFAFFAFAAVCAGGAVVLRAYRADIAIAFLGFYAAILFGRSWWLNEPLAIPLHRLQNGTLLIFAFHMISDPRTTPTSRAMRILFAALVALGAGYVHFVLYRPNGPIYALAALTPLVPFMNRILPGAPHRWDARPTPKAGADERPRRPDRETVDSLASAGALALRRSVR